MDEFNMDFPYEYGIERDGRLISKVYGRPIAGGNLINVQERDGIKPMDVAIDTQTGERYSVSEIRPAVINNETVWYVLVVRKVEAQPLPTQSINIGTISGGSVAVGADVTFNQGICAEDFLKVAGEMRNGDGALLCELVLALKQLEETGEPIRKGFFSKFRGFLNQNSPVIGMLGQWLIQYGMSTM